MTVTSFAVSDVIDALVTNLGAALDVPVYDGVIVASDSNLDGCVVIGSDGSDGAQRPFRLDHPWHDFELTTDENGQIQCVVVVWSGDANPDTFATQRGQALAILQDVDTELRTNISSSELGVSQLLWSKVDSADMVQMVMKDGTETRLPFTVGYRALLQVT